MQAKAGVTKFNKAGIDEMLMASNLRKEKQKAQKQEEPTQSEKPTSLRQAVMQAKRSKSLAAKAIPGMEQGKGGVTALMDAKSAVKKFNRIMKIVFVVNTVLPFLFFLFSVLFVISFFYLTANDLVKWWVVERPNAVKNSPAMQKWEKYDVISP